jgi:hypothetical protein
VALRTRKSAAGELFYERHRAEGLVDGISALFFARLPEDRQERLGLERAGGGLRGAERDHVLDHDVAELRASVVQGTARAARSGRPPRALNHAES